MQQGSVYYQSSSISTFIQGTQVSLSCVLPLPWARLVSALLSSSWVATGPHTPHHMDWYWWGKIVEEGDSHILSRKLLKVAFGCCKAQFELQTPLRFGNWLEMLIKLLKYLWLLFSVEDARVWSWVGSGLLFMKVNKMYPGFSCWVRWCFPKMMCMEHSGLITAVCLYLLVFFSFLDH